jgi:predicted signal transduction protein with EAL and GGDEF domain
LLDGALAAPFLIEGKEIRIAMTTGVAVFPPDGDDADVLFRNAEAALKRAKRAGDRILFYHPEMNARVAETLILENRLRRAIEEEQFVLHYQPKISAASGRVTGLEALIRWMDPVAGLVPPGKFIPILEETGMILEVGTWTIRRALIESRNWRLTHGGPLRIAINVSAIQLRQRDFVDTVKRSIDGLGIAATHLELELTETMIMEGIEENVQKLQAVRDMGVPCLPGEAAGERPEDRPQLRRHHDAQPPQHDARVHDHLPGPRARPEGDCGRRGVRGTGQVAATAEVRRVAGLSLQ